MIQSVIEKIVKKIVNSINSTNFHVNIAVIGQKADSYILPYSNSLKTYISF
jgi:hypothetical protein